MQKHIKTWLIIILSIIIACNLPPINYFFQEEYIYQNRDGSFQFTEIPGNSLDFEVVKIRFDRFKRENPENPNLKLYRSFQLKPWRFWEWWNMASNYERFQLPYLAN